ncbi:unknown [Bacteroides sp. CAG:598]|nr:unknown [Bacteroides sp. CAG:598]
MKKIMYMIRMTVSGLDAGFGTNSYVNFVGQNSRKNNGDTEGSPVEYNRRSNNLVKVPVIVLMAMLPAMMNAKTPVTNLSETNGAKTEMVAPILIDSEELDEMTTIAPYFSNPQNAQTKAPFGVTSLLGQKIYHYDTFMKDGKKHYIVYSSIRTPDYVDKVSVFPEGFPNKSGVLLPWVEELVYHNLGKGKEYCGIIVRSVNKLQNGRYKTTYEEVRLPNEVAQNLIDLLADDSTMKNATSIKYSKTKSPNLRQTKIYIH